MALVTGSTSGIGEFIAKTLSELGATVIINSSKSKERGEELAASLKNASYCQGDISDHIQILKIVDHVKTIGSTLDILVNNAGITHLISHSDLEAANVDVWKDIFSVNVFGTWDLTVGLMPYLRASNGVVINISSIAGIRPTGSSIPYSVSKAAINQMTKLLAKTVGPEVRVNAVAPGLVETPWTKDWGPAKDIAKSQTPLNDVASPKDVTELVLGLISSRFVTGEVVLVDGGWNLR
ncbi:MAG: SDR family oxidoreductase [Acidimicrobiales bacterium]|nr:SDR family oxidoreductase [Acidimicrobiales bacterium]